MYRSRLKCNLVVHTGVFSGMEMMERLSRAVWRKNRCQFQNEPVQSVVKLVHLHGYVMPEGLSQGTVIKTQRRNNACVHHVVQMIYIAG